MIEEIVRRLAAVGIKPETRELRDALWLARYVVPSSGTGPHGGLGEGLKQNKRYAEDTAGNKSLATDAAAPRPNPPENGAGAALYAAGNTGSAHRLNGMETRSPSVPALRHQLQLSRALRPLKRRVPAKLLM